VHVRPGTAADLGLLEQMLFEAFYWDAAVTRPVFDVCREDPEFTRLLAGWGRLGDRAVVAEEQGAPLGAAWFRLWTAECHSYGFVDARTPELAIAVRPAYRGKRVGRVLLDRLIVTARTDGFPALSLSVSPLNPARYLYESLGFQKVGEGGTSWTLRLLLG
jgi:GNAT superfamily N-acetyltransferase